MTLKTVVVKGRGMRCEAKAGGAVTPGHLIKLNSSGDAVVHATAGGVTQRSFAVENELAGNNITDAYAANDTLFYEILERGSEVYAILADSNVAVIGSFLSSAGDGTLRVASTSSSIAQGTGAVTDDDSAASNGTAVYLHIDEKAEHANNMGHLESVTAGNANTYFDVGTNGSRIRVNDDDAAATGGLQIYFDEDAANDDERFLANNTVTGKDVFVVGHDGKALRIKHSATASSLGVALYIDDDGATVAARLLFISPTNAAGAYKTDDVFTLAAPTLPDAIIAVAKEAVTTSGAVARILAEVL